MQFLTIAALATAALLVPVSAEYKWAISGFHGSCPPTGRNNEANGCIYRFNVTAPKADTKRGK